MKFNPYLNRWVADYAGEPLPDNLPQPGQQRMQQPAPPAPQPAQTGPVATYITPIDKDGDEDTYQLPQEQPQVFMTRDDKLIIIATRHGNAVDKDYYDRRPKMTQQPPLDPRYVTHEDLRRYLEQAVSQRSAVPVAAPAPSSAPAAGFEGGATV